MQLLIRQTSRQLPHRMEEHAMFRFTRRPTTQAAVRFCDSCAEVTTLDERARRRFERARTDALAVTGPR
jgi:hypothetical protein